MPSKSFLVLCLLTLGVLSACLAPVRQSPSGQIIPISVRSDIDPRIVVYGDSMMAWNSLSRNTTPDILARMVGEPIDNRAITAAQMSNVFNPFLDIRRQRVNRNWDVIIVNGGANDFVFECMCAACARVTNALVSEDSKSGQIPEFLTQLRATGSQVLYVGYHRPKKIGSILGGCENEIEELERRVKAFTRTQDGITFVSLAESIPPGRPDLYAFDRFHPSAEGSAALAETIQPVLIAALERARAQ